MNPKYIHMRKLTHSYTKLIVTSHKMYIKRKAKALFQINVKVSDVYIWF